MMNRAFATVFGVIFVISILEVTTFNSKEMKESEGIAPNEFHEFDDPASEYSEAAFQHGQHDHDQLGDDENIKGIRTTGGNFPTVNTRLLNMPPIRFSFCVSCGYRQAFDQLSQVLSEKFPGIQIEGANYPPTQIKALLAKFIGFTKIALIVMIIIGRDPFASLGMQTPAFVTWMLSNKLSSCLMLFMLSNSVEGMLMSTGAFEIRVGDELVWSKLESGRPPSPGELIQVVESQLAIHGSARKLSGGATAGASFGFSDDGDK